MIEEEAARVRKRVSRGRDGERGLFGEGVFSETRVQGFQRLQRRSPPPAHSKVVDSTR